MPFGTARINTLSRFVAAEEGEARPISFTVNGNAQIDTSRYQFGQASALFDGTGDYIVTEETNSLVLDGDFTIEFWYQVDEDTGSASGTLIGTKESGSTRTNDFFVLHRNFDMKLQLYVTSEVSVAVASSVVSADTWNHVAVVRNGTGSNNVTLYLNGVSQHVGTTNQSVGLDDTINQYAFGAMVDGSSALNATGNGWIDEIRFSDTARYTSGFTPPTSAFTNDANTLLLMHMNGTDGSTNFIDDTGERFKVGISAEGGAEKDTAVVKIGTASYLGNGTNSYLNTDNIMNAIGTGDFTVEAWVYPISRAGNHGWFCLGTAGQTGAIFGQYKETAPNDNSIRFSLGGTSIYGSIAAGQWIHVAMVRSSGTMELFVNGTSQGTAANSQSLHAGDQIIGALNNGTTQWWEGNIDELRISNTARYTTGFTAPTSAFTNDANTLLLIHADGADGNTDFEDDNG